MRNLINKNFPQHGIIGEELGTENEESEFVWVLDPIDGTKAFVSGLPVFGSMIGLMKNKLPIIGLIDQPITKERIWGSDQGSYLNGKIINTRKCKSIKKVYNCKISRRNEDPNSGGVIYRRSSVLFKSRFDRALPRCGAPGVLS